VLTCALLIPLTAGDYDLSITGVLTLSQMMIGILNTSHGVSVYVCIVLALLMGALVGLINGVMITIVRVAPLIATLGMNSILFGAALVYTNGAPHGGIAPGFAFFGQGHLMAFPISTVCWLVVALTIAWVTRSTVFGRQLYAVGASATAAQMMGIPARRIVIIAYILSSVMAVLGGLLITSYIGSPSLGIGDQFLLSSIAATIVGGTALTGGIGSIVGTIGGTIFVTELNSFTNIVRVSTGTQFVLQGVVIALSVLLYRFVGVSRTSITPQ